MHQPKPYKCLICGAEVPALPLPVLQHQMSHVSRRPYSRSVPKLSGAEPLDEPADQGHPRDGS